MNGKDLLKAMSYVDEAYIQEAEEPARRRIHWVRYSAMAACLALVLFSWRTYQLLNTPTCIGSMPKAELNAVRREEIYVDDAIIPIGTTAEASDAPMMAALLPQMTVKITGWEENILLCTVLDGGSTNYPIGTELRIAAPETFHAIDGTVSLSQNQFLVTLPPEVTEEDVLYPLDISPIVSIP